MANVNLSGANETIKTIRGNRAKEKVTATKSRDDRKDQGE